MRAPQNHRAGRGLEETVGIGFFSLPSIHYTSFWKLYLYLPLRNYLLSSHSLIFQLSNLVKGWVHGPKDEVQPMLPFWNLTMS